MIPSSQSSRCMRLCALLHGWWGKATWLRSRRRSRVAPPSSQMCWMFLLQRKSGMKKFRLFAWNFAESAKSPGYLCFALQKPVSSSRGYSLTFHYQNANLFIVYNLFCSFTKLWKVQLSSKESQVVSVGWLKRYTDGFCQVLCFESGFLKNRSGQQRLSPGLVLASATTRVLHHINMFYLLYIYIYTYIYRYTHTHIYIYMYIYFSISLRTAKTMTHQEATDRFHTICQAQSLLQRVGLAAAAFRYRWLGTRVSDLTRPHPKWWLLAKSPYFREI